MLSLIRNSPKHFKTCYRLTSTITNTNEENPSTKFETVFSFDSVKYIALINRLKVYHFAGSTVAVPSSGILTMFDVVSSETFLATAYIGFTGAAVLTIATLPFKNVIGHLYISEDNKNIKISSLDYWGRRIDRIIPTKKWIPLMDLPPRTSDAFYLTPQLTDGTTYKLPLKFGKVINSQKIGQVLE